MGKIVLRQPRYHALLLHIRATRDVDDQISQVLPMSAYKDNIRYASRLLNVINITVEFSSQACTNKYKVTSSQQLLPLTSQHQQLQAGPWGHCPWLTHWQQTNHQCWRPHIPLPGATQSGTPLHLFDPPLGKKVHESAFASHVYYLHISYSFWNSLSIKYSERSLPFFSEVVGQKQHIVNANLVHKRCTEPHAAVTSHTAVALQLLHTLSNIVLWNILENPSYKVVCARRYLRSGLPSHSVTQAPLHHFTMTSKDSTETLLDRPGI